MKSKVLIDVWDGEFGDKHVARFLRSRSEALKLADREVQAGFFVNLLQADGITIQGDLIDFDKRHIH